MTKHTGTFLVALLGGFMGAWLHSSIQPVAAAPGQGLWVPGPDGKDRIQIATYEAAGERGLPLVGLFDNRSQLRLLLRLAGTNESPVVVMKDRRGRDRLVMGLGMSGEEKPFLVTTDEQGRKTDLLNP